MHHSFDQRTAEWVSHRIGKVTASRIADLMARTKSGYSASRDKYRGQLIAERLTGTPMATFSSPAMQWGTDTECEAREAYAQHMLCGVVEVGFCDHPTIAMSGASPDGCVGEDGLVEIKCPETHTHIETLLSGNIPDKYVKQMLWQLACTGRDWCDFVSFDPRMPENMQLFVKRLDRCAETIATIEAEVSAFIAEIDETVGKLLARYEGRDLKEQLTQSLREAA